MVHAKCINYTYIMGMLQDQCIHQLLYNTDKKEAVGAYCRFFDAGTKYQFPL